jgi:hypothetical protein
MSMLDVAIVPPHLTVLSMRMAVGLYITRISIQEVHPEFPPRRDAKPEIALASRWVDRAAASLGDRCVILIGAGTG